VKATNWEFTNRALFFGLVFALAFSLSSVDPENATASLANWLGARMHLDAELVAGLLFALVAFVLVVAAFIRTWASSYLHTNVVYANQVKTESLVADGPYRRVRNPLYFANVLMAVGMGAMMSRSGFFVGIVAMLVVCYCPTKSARNWRDTVWGYGTDLGRPLVPVTSTRSPRLISPPSRRKRRTNSLWGAYCLM
jgi:protein-S-isoprenylcysteine O-methyltransferase Ste14